MAAIHPKPEIRVLTGGPSEVETDLLVVPLYADADDAMLESLDIATGGEVGRARRRGEFRAVPNEIFVTPVVDNGWQSRRIALLGTGAAGDGASDRLRSGAAAVAIEARRRRVSQLVVVLPGLFSPERAGQVVVEGLMLGDFEDRRYKTTRDDQTTGPPLARCDLLIQDPADAAAVATAVDRGTILGSSANVARELANEPANVLTPTVFADRARESVAEHGIEVEVLEEEQLRGLGMGLLLGVTQGSCEPARLMIMRHTPTEAPDSPVLGLVGKGVTFDSGGISLKSPDGMDLMKRDMAGGAAVVGAMRAIGALRLPLHVIGLVPMTENMPGGRATRPGDILTSASGLTVEVLNTDAEGRLILADALWYARQLGATHLVDVATLTGSCVVALGKAASGLFGQPAAWVEQVRAAGARAGERAWPLPLYEEYREQLRSEMADLANVGGRPAGACTAASFLGAFAGDTPWAHLDIAGTAWADDAGKHHTKGATGVMVRALAELAGSSSSW